MMKLNMTLILPMLLNLMMIFMMMLSTKINKFHPIMLLLILIFLTFFICLKINFLLKSFISFILFLIMIGGLMVIFMYITSLTNNELFSLNYKNIVMNLIKISPIMIIMILILLNYNSIFSMNLTDSINFNKLILLKNFKNMNIMYKEMNNKSSYFIMIYLYYSMICIMNICYKFKSPLRQLLF